jgi:hypothetical protein
MICSGRPSLGRVIVRMLPVVLLACGALWTCVHATTWSGLPGTDADSGDETGRGQQLDERLSQSMDRINDKVRVARALREGRLTLVAAAARFRDLDHMRPPFPWKQFREAHAGASDDERHCREVLAFVREGFLDETPEERAARAARLEAELHQLLARGELCLPAPDPVAARGPGLESYVGGPR